MSRDPRLVVLLVTTACAGLCACGHPRVQPPQRQAGTLVVLLPDADDGTVGRAFVSTTSGMAELASARASTSVVGNGAPGTVAPLSEAEVQTLFGSALTTMPRHAHQFTLYFQFESDELTAESRALVPQVVQAVKDYPFPDVEVIGHTDTTGSAASNVELGMRRATLVRRLLLDAGLDGSIVDATSHGEADLLVATSDETMEPRNRRVEISVR
ncbi:MAG TPA: OmpA family protein [Vicinamibacterales bacterium]|jgi:outer membrane protein OmpA-like peptidoglycan-associated protein|nr:OmpA family protein [Vicinamibacterales bacterium]